MLYGLVKKGLVTPYLLLKGNLGACGAGAVLWWSCLCSLSLLLWPQLPSTGTVGLRRPFLCSARGFRLPSSPTSSCLLQSKNYLNLVYVTTHFNAYHTSFIRISVFAFLWLPSYQFLFCGCRMKMEIVHIFNFQSTFFTKTLTFSIYFNEKFKLLSLKHYSFIL